MFPFSYLRCLIFKSYLKENRVKYLAQSSSIGPKIESKLKHSDYSYSFRSKTGMTSLFNSKKVPSTLVGTKAQEQSNNFPLQNIQVFQD